MGFQSALKLQTALQIGIVVLSSIMILAVKGMILFRKMARENLARLTNLDTPIPFFRIFPKKTYLFILIFAPTGITLGKFLEDPVWRSIILFGVGAALFSGGVFYLAYWNKYFGSPAQEETT